MRTSVQYGLVALVTFFGLTACVKDMSPPVAAAGSITNKAIKLKVQGSNFTVDEPVTPGCPGNDAARKGCLLVGQNDIAVAQFRLLQHAQFDLTSLWICAGSDKPASTDDCSLTPQQIAEFMVISSAGVSLPDSGGHVDLQGVDDFALLDQNTMQQDYYYIIETCDNSGTCLELDPRIRNGGRGGDR